MDHRPPVLAVDSDLSHQSEKRVRDQAEQADQKEVCFKVDAFVEQSRPLAQLIFVEMLKKSNTNFHSLHGVALLAQNSIDAALLFNGLWEKAELAVFLGERGLEEEATIA